MPRFALLVVVLAMTLAACASDSSPTPAAVSSPTTIPSAGGGSVPPDGSGDDPGANASDRGPLAPEIVLALGEGGTFVLSEEQKPVYMVFWAEW